MPSERLKCLVQVNRILYPKFFSSGEWALFLADVQDVYEGEPYAHEIKVKGKAYSLDIGAMYLLTAEIDENDKYGLSYQIVSFTKEYNPTTHEHKRAFLNSIFTEKQVDSLYEVIEDPFEAIQDEKEDLLQKAKGIGPATAKRMIAKFKADFEKGKAYVALGQYDLSTSLIDSLIRRFHGDIDRMIHTINENPYVMMFEIDGIGWKKADQIAMAKGIKPDDPLRIKANILHQLNTIIEQGHTWITPQWLINTVLPDLGLSVDCIDRFRQCLYSLHEDGELWWDEDKTKIALLKLRNIEEQIAAELHRIFMGDPLHPRTQEDSGDLLSQIEMQQGWQFTDEQKAAINNTLNHNVNIITGYGGTGKSSVVSGVLKILQGHEFAQCALSGRAAARLTEVTGKEGMTIHRLLEYTVHGGFYYNQNHHLPYDIIILDEISMVGAEIFLSLIQAIPTGSKLIMIGDDGQLESIGLCNIFKDMLESGVIPVSRLTKIHRQAAKSAIITESLRVRQQEPLIEDGWVGEEIRGELEDLKLNVYEDQILSQETIIDEYKALLNEGISYHDIQIVVPMKQRGFISTFLINGRIQGLVNPHRDGASEITIGAKKNDASHAYTLRVNDRVIVTKNMYRALRYDPDKETLDDENMPDFCPVYNGDRGIVKIINSSFIVIAFDLWGDVLIKREDFNKIELGYALSCHKLQGSEANYVIVGLDMGARILLTKEWLYTAITRAKKRCVVCAEGKALNYAVFNSNISIKQTMLEGLLRDQFLKEGVDE